MARSKMPVVHIEFPSQGATYCRDVFGVYEYSVYGRESVNRGQEKRVFLDSFETLDEARRAYPYAAVTYGAAEEAAKMNSEGL